MYAVGYSACIRATDPGTPAATDCHAVLAGVHVAPPVAVGGAAALGCGCGGRTLLAQPSMPGLSLGHQCLLVLEWQV